jgi:hypothetical protein
MEWVEARDTAHHPVAPKTPTDVDLALASRVLRGLSS